MKTVSQLDAEGFFIGPVFADESPLEPGVYLLPAGSVDAPPVDVPVGKRARWDGSGFVLEDEPLSPKPADPPSWSMVRSAILLNVRAFREDVLNRLMGIAFAATVAGDLQTRDGCLAARQALLDITKDARVVASANEADLQLAIKTRYAEISAQAPLGVLTAFAAMNI